VQRGAEVCNFLFFIHYMQDIIPIFTSNEQINKINKAYWERNQLVCALSKVFPSFISEQDPDMQGYDKDFKYVCYIELPTGQVSWHLMNTEIEYFSHLEIKKDVLSNFWDGHSDELKYERLKNLTK